MRQTLARRARAILAGSDAACEVRWRRGRAPRCGALLPLLRAARCAPRGALLYLAACAPWVQRPSAHRLAPRRQRRRRRRLWRGRAQAGARAALLRGAVGGVARRVRRAAFSAAAPDARPFAISRHRARRRRRRRRFPAARGPALGLGPAAAASQDPTGAFPRLQHCWLASAAARGVGGCRYAVCARRRRQRRAPRRAAGRWPLAISGAGCCWSARAARGAAGPGAAAGARGRGGGRPAGLRAAAAGTGARGPRGRVGPCYLGWRRCHAFLHTLVHA